MITDPLHHPNAGEHKPSRAPDGTFYFHCALWIPLPWRWEKEETFGICGDRIGVLKPHAGSPEWVLAEEPSYFIKSEEAVILRHGQYCGPVVYKCPRCKNHPDMPLHILGNFCE